MCNRYNSNLSDARIFGIKKGSVKGASTGFVYFIIFNIYALAFWYGFKLVKEDIDYTAGTLMIVSDWTRDAFASWDLCSAY